MGELAAGGDAELPEHLAQVVVDGVGAEVQLGGDLGVGRPGRGQPGHFRFLGRAERLFASRMGATTIEVPSSHVAMVSHPDEVARLIESAAQAVPA